mgnify:CR=1 FL=1
MSKIAIIGATGRAGSQLLEEALRRGHSVTAIARDTSKIAPRAGVITKDVDALDAHALHSSLDAFRTYFCSDKHDDFACWIFINYSFKKETLVVHFNECNCMMNVFIDTVIGSNLNPDGISNDVIR